MDGGNVQIYMLLCNIHVHVQTNPRPHICIVIEQISNETKHVVYSKCVSSSSNPLFLCPFLCLYTRSLSELAREVWRQLKEYAP